MFLVITRKCGTQVDYSRQYFDTLPAAEAVALGCMPGYYTLVYSLQVHTLECSYANSTFFGGLVQTAGRQVAN